MTTEQREAIEYARRERRQYVADQDLHVVDDDGDFSIESRIRTVHRKTASHPNARGELRLLARLADTCADCGGSTAVGTPDPHVCK